MENNSEFSVSGFISILIYWFRFIIISFILVLLFLILPFVILIPNEYKSSATLIIPQTGMSLNLGAVGSLLSSAAPLLGGGKGVGGVTSTEKAIGILESRLLKLKIINDYDLFSYYKIENQNKAKTLKAFENDYEVDVDENNMILVSVINKNPTVSQKITQSVCEYLDTLSRKYAREESKNNRVFIEKRFNKNQFDLKESEINLNKYQKKYGIIDVPEQVKSTIKATSQLEVELIQQEINLNGLKNQFGEDSKIYQFGLDQFKMLKNRIDQLENNEYSLENLSVILPLKQLPDLGLEYIRLRRELEIQSKIMEFLYPMYEQAKIEENKNIPTIVIVDPPYLADYKFKPKRMLIVILLSSLTLISLIFISVLFTSTLNHEKDNIFNEKISRIAIMVKKYFRIKY